MPGRRSRPWAEAAARYALPHLPGDWLAYEGGLIMRPVGLIARGVTAQPGRPQIILHPLYLPLDVADTGWKLSTERWFPGHFSDFRTVDDGEPYMTKLAAALREVVIPYLEETGTLEGYLQRCRRANEGIPHESGDPWYLLYQAATAIVLRRYDQAADDLAAIHRIAARHGNESPWLPALSARAAALRDRLLADPGATREHLLAGTGEQRRRRGLPITDD